MQEHAVTIAGTRHALEEPFFVLATENPIEMEGRIRSRGAARSLPPQGARTALRLRTSSPSSSSEPRGSRRRPPGRVLAQTRRARARRAVPRRGGRRAGAALRGVAWCERQLPGRARSDAPGEASPCRFGAGVRGAQSLIFGSQIRGAARRPRGTSRSETCSARRSRGAPAPDPAQLRGRRPTECPTDQIVEELVACACRPCRRRWRRPSRGA